MIDMATSDVQVVQEQVCNNISIIWSVDIDNRPISLHSLEVRSNRHEEVDTRVSFGIWLINVQD
jgi:hypothetical protein